MDDLTYTLRQLCQRNRDGSHATQADRMRSLALAARQLREAGFRQMKASQRVPSKTASRICAGGPRKLARRVLCRRTTRSLA